MASKKLYKIEIHARGKYRDEYGNPYYAYIAILHYKFVSYFRNVIVYMPMHWGDSGESDGLKWALEGINEYLGKKTYHSKIKPSDKRIEYHYKHVSHDADLENPLKWKLS